MIPPAGPHFARLPLLYQPGMQLDVQVRDSVLVTNRTVDLLPCVLALARLAVCSQAAAGASKRSSTLNMHQLCIVSLRQCPSASWML